MHVNACIPIEIIIEALVGRLKWSFPVTRQTSHWAPYVWFGDWWCSWCHTSYLRQGIIKQHWHGIKLPMSNKWNFYLALLVCSTSLDGVYSDLCHRKCALKAFSVPFTSSGPRYVVNCLKLCSFLCSKYANLFRSFSVKLPSTSMTVAQHSAKYSDKVGLYI